MKILSRRTHGVLDYIVGVLLILAPYVLGFSDVGGAAVTVPQVIGAIIIVASLLTRYELGAFKVIPFGTHLAADVVLGLVLLLSPWIWGFSDEIAWPHVVVGLLLIGAGLMTRNDNAPVAAAAPAAGDA